MTPQEQLMLELINRARMDPNGEATRYGIALNEGLAAGTISSASKQVLAGADTLAAAADNHAKWMLVNNNMVHNETGGTSGFTGVTPGDRMTAAGYHFDGPAWWNGENIAVAGKSVPMTDELATQFIQEQHQALFVDTFDGGRGHRLNILSDKFQEVGIGQATGPFHFSNGTFNSSVVSEDFAKAGTKVFVTGVVYSDTVVNDDFFSVGEQTVGRTVSGAGVTDTTGAGGGYELQFGAGGTKSLTFDLATGDVTVGIAVGSTNAKLDVVNGKQVWTDTSITSVSSNVKEIHALGHNSINLDGGSSSQWIHGNDANNVITGHTGHDRLFGGAGADTFVFLKGDTSSTRSTADTIYDFSHAEGDKVDFSHRDANSLLAGDQEFTFIGNQSFHKVAGELHYVQSGNDTYVEGDTNGNGKADFIVHLDDPVTLTQSDFAL
jgi:Ca2+-binding RTX toxin-like protein